MPLPAQWDIEHEVYCWVIVEHDTDRMARHARDTNQCDVQLYRHRREGDVLVDAKRHGFHRAL